MTQEAIVHRDAAVSLYLALQAVNRAVGSQSAFAIKHPDVVKQMWAALAKAEGR